MIELLSNSLMINLVTYVRVKFIVYNIMYMSINVLLDFIVRFQGFKVLESSLGIIVSFDRC